MSAFHRVDDVRTMPALRFINYAMRLVAYKGIVRALVEAEKHDEQMERVPDNVRAHMPATAQRDRTVASDADTLKTDPALAGMFEVKGGPDA